MMHVSEGTFYLFLVRVARYYILFFSNYAPGDKIQYPVSSVPGINTLLSRSQFLTYQH